MANPQSNRIDTTVSAPDQTTITGGFTTINTTLDTYAQALTDDERESLFSLKEENLVFSQDVKAQAAILFGSFGPEVQAISNRLKTDLTMVDNMDLLHKSYAIPLELRIKDTGRLAKHEAYVGALAIYKIIEAGAALGLAGYQAAYDILKVRFAAQGVHPGPPTP
jgi:hypothetical protein